MKDQTGCVVIRRLEACGYRISSDTRFQPVADPVDDHWMVNIDKPSRKQVDIGKGEVSSISMEEARAEWNL